MTERLPDYKIIQRGISSFVVNEAYWYIGLYWRYLKTFDTYKQAKNYIMWEKLSNGKLSISALQLAKVLKNVR